MLSSLSALALSSAIFGSSLLGSSAPVAPVEPEPEPEEGVRSWVLDTGSETSWRTPRLALADDGTGSGHDGCNGFSAVVLEEDHPWADQAGYWEQVDDRIHFRGLWRATQMACYPKSALEEADTVIVDGDNLLLYKAGELIGTMIPV